MILHGVQWFARILRHTFARSGMAFLGYEAEEIHSDAFFFSKNPSKRNTFREKLIKSYRFSWNYQK